MRNKFLLFSLVAAAALLWIHPAHASPEIESAVRAYLDKLTPEQLRKSNAYFEGGYWIQLWNFLIGAVLALGILRLGWAAKLRDVTDRISRFHFVRDFSFVAVYFGATTLLTFPFAVYTDYFREHQYGLSNMDFGGWLIDFLKTTGVAMVLFSFFVAILYKLIRRYRTTWWVWGSACMFFFVCFVVMLAPVYFSPMFNTYKPLEPGALRTSILSMARSNGIPGDEVWEFDASKQSNRVSANVSGLFGTTRISLNDNLLKRCTPAEIRHVMGHEMGHYVLNHALKGLILISLLWLIGFACTFYVGNWAIRTFCGKWRVLDQGDIAGFPLLILLFSTFVFLSAPILNTIVRTQEIEADMFGLNLAREPDGAAEVALKLSEYRKMSPSKIEEFLFYDHPSGEYRIRAAMTWKLNAEKNKSN